MGRSEGDMGRGEGEWGGDMTFTVLPKAMRPAHASSHTHLLQPLQLPQHARQLRPLVGQLALGLQQLVHQGLLPLLLVATATLKLRPQGGKGVLQLGAGLQGHGFPLLPLPVCQRQLLPELGRLPLGGVAPLCQGRELDFKSAGSLLWGWWWGR